VVLTLGGIGLPAALFGSAPRDQEWSAAAAAVRVVDGDTLRLGERTVRLAGLRSPERGQTCSTAGGAGFDCGAAAAEALSRLLHGRDLSCQIVGRDHFGRALAECRAGELDANRSLVDAGWALAEAPSLEMTEAAARNAERGLWSHPPGAPPSWQTRR
jgi:endonuclease YncB( thermonuclease family)